MGHLTGIELLVVIDITKIIAGIYWPILIKAGEKALPSDFKGNCYLYAINRPVGSIGPQGKPVPPDNGFWPGHFAGEIDVAQMKKGSLTCAEVLRRVQADFKNDTKVKEIKSGNCPSGYHKIKAEMDLGDVGFHFKREGPGSGWSEKLDDKHTPQLANPKKATNKGDTQCPDICVPD